MIEVLKGVRCLLYPNRWAVFGYRNHYHNLWPWRTQGWLLRSPTTRASSNRAVGSTAMRSVSIHIPQPFVTRSHIMSQKRMLLLGSGLGRWESVLERRKGWKELTCGVCGEVNVRWMGSRRSDREESRGGARKSERQDVERSESDKIENNRSATSSNTSTSTTTTTNISKHATQTTPSPPQPQYSTPIATTATNTTPNKDNIENKTQEAHTPQTTTTTTTTITPQPPAPPSAEEVPSRVQRYFLGRYSWYLGKFHASLKNEMPDTFKMLHIFTVGLKEFIIDFTELIKVLALLSLPGRSLSSLSHHQLEVYYSMPWDMVRVFPVLVLSSLPFGQNLAFPIGYWFPRHLLCHHFWDIQQRHDFAVMTLRSRLYNARPVFRYLQAGVLLMGKEERERCMKVFHKIGSGIHPDTKEVLALAPLFDTGPFNLRKIRTVHVNALLRLHGRSVWLLRRQRLRDHARILHCMDKALCKEGVDSLTLDNLKKVLIFRGLNPTSMSTPAMLEYLHAWLAVSQQIDSKCYSLLLHLPIFLAYNQPSNFALIYL